MAQSGFTPIQLYYSTTPSSTPSAGNLVPGELAINTADGKLFYEDSGGVVQVIATKAGASGDVVGPASATDGNLAAFDGTTGKLIKQAATVTAAQGGTGQSTYTTGDLLYASGASALSKLGIGTNGQVLTSSGTAPQWSTLSGVAVTTFSAGTTGFTPSTATSGAVTLGGTLATTNGGTGLTSFTANRVFYASSTSAIGQSANLTFDGTTLTAAGFSGPLNGSVGASTPSTGAFTTLSASSTVTLSGGTANGVLYLDGSKVATSGTALAFNGTLFSVTGNAKIGTGAATNSQTFMVNNPSGTATQIQLFQDGVESWTMGMPASSAGLAWAASGSEQMRLTSTGLGIGTSSPTNYGAGYRTVSANGTSSGVFELQSNGTPQAILVADSSDLQVQALGARPIRFFTNGSERMRLDSSGNLGIGTSSPAGKVDSVSNAYAAFVARSSTSGAGQTVDALKATDSAAANFANAVYSATAHIWNYAGATEGMRLDSSGNLGIGTTSPAYKLVVSNGGASGIEFGPEFATNQNLIQSYNRSGAAYVTTVYDAAQHRFRISGTEQMRLDASGNLGLGVTPSAWDTATFRTLQVGSGVGSVSLSGRTDNAKDMVLGSNMYYGTGNFRYVGTGVATQYRMDGGEHQWFNAPSGTAGNAISFTQAMTLDASGNLLVGGTTQLYGAAGRGLIQVSGSSSALLGFGTTGNTGLGYINHTGTAMEVVNAQNSYLSFATNATERARITSGGDLLVGTTDAAQTSGAGFKVGGAGGAGVGQVAIVDPDSTNTTVTYRLYSTGAAAYRFYVGLGGTVYATSATITSLSDQRLKENIQDIDVGLNAIMALRPRKFDWKAGKGKDKKGDRGWIAQEFEQVFPDMIDEWRDPSPEGEEPYKAVNADLIPVLVKAIQEQQAIIDSLKARLDAANL